MGTAHPSLQLMLISASFVMVYIQRPVMPEAAMYMMVGIDVAQLKDVKDVRDVSPPSFLQDVAYSTYVACVCACAVHFGMFSHSTQIVQWTPNSTASIPLPPFFFLPPF